MNTIAITGSSGLLGSTLLQTLPSHGFDVRAIQSDVRESVVLGKEIEHASPSWIIHTAAKVNVGECEKNPADAYAVNADGTKNVVDAARALNAGILYISTVSVFSGQEGNYRETDTPEPLNVHNKTKVEGEKHVLAYDKGIVLRLNLIGIHPNGSRGTNFMEWLVDTIRANKDMSAFEDVFFNPLSNWSIAEMIASIIERKTDAHVLHIGSSDVLSKADVVEMVAQRFSSYSGKITRASVDTIADGVVRPKQMTLNCDYTKAVLGATMPTLESEIDTILTRAAL